MAILLWFVDWGCPVSSTEWSWPQISSLATLPPRPASKQQGLYKETVFGLLPKSCSPSIVFLNFIMLAPARIYTIPVCEKYETNLKESLYTQQAKITKRFTVTAFIAKKSFPSKKWRFQVFFCMILNYFCINFPNFPLSGSF